MIEFMSLMGALFLIAFFGVPAASFWAHAIIDWGRGKVCPFCDEK